MITNLTPEQEAELPFFRQRYLDLACGGQRIDRTALQSALNDAYALIGKSAPQLFIFDSPAACMLALKIFDMPKRGQLQSQLWSQLWSQLGSHLGSQLRDQLWDQLNDQLGDQLQSQLSDQLGSQLRDQLGGQLWSQLGDQLWDQLGSQLGSQIRGQLWDQLGSQLGSQIRDQLWNQLSGQLRDQLWLQLWDQLTDQLGNQKIWNSNFLWGSQDLYWIAFYRFCQNIGGNYGDAGTKLDIIEAISTQCEWWWPYENIVVVSQKPTVVKWDDERRLHCESGPAVQYADGFSLSSWHGQAIPNEWVTGSPPSAYDAMHWPNMDQRAAASEIIGWHNVVDELVGLGKGKVIDDSGDPIWGRLVEVNLPGSGKERFLDALCGTGRRFSLPVPPKTKSVDEAQSVLHGGLPVEILKNFDVRT